MRNVQFIARPETDAELRSRILRAHREKEARLLRMIETETGYGLDLIAEHYNLRRTVKGEVIE